MNRFRSKKGFTLAELLISVTLLGFVTVMVTVMTSSILSSTASMREVAQADILGNEVLDNLQNRLRTALNVRIGGGSVTFDLDSANPDFTFGLADGKIILGRQTDGGLTGGTPLEGVSYGNLRVTALHFQGDEARGTVDVSVEIAYGESALWKGGITVKPLNGLTAVS